MRDPHERHTASEPRETEFGRSASSRHHHPREEVPYRSWSAGRVAWVRRNHAPDRGGSGPIRESTRLCRTCWSGAGTVLTPIRPPRIAAGAQFVVTPGFMPRVAESACGELTDLPGVMTPTEIACARRRLNDLKFFPAEPAVAWPRCELCRTVPDGPLHPDRGIGPANLTPTLRAHGSGGWRQLDVRAR